MKQEVGAALLRLIVDRCTDIARDVHREKLGPMEGTVLYMALEEFRKGLIERSSYFAQTVNETEEEIKSFINEAMDNVIKETIRL